MFDPENFKAQLFSLNDQNFEKSAIEVFQYQWSHNPVYRSYCDRLYIDPEKVNFVGKIPFLPIEFFKTHQVKSGDFQPQKVFKSSGTTGQARSQHYVKDLEFYHRVSKKAFEMHYGDISEWEILALLPSYQEQGDSSLISMVEFFIRHSKPGSHFMLDEFDSFREIISKPTENKRLVIGVSFALLDFGIKLDTDIHVTALMETGGMKGRRKEMTRYELHEILQLYYKQDEIHSEYGMTELLSQAYGSQGNFSTPPWCKVMIRDVNDPFSYLDSGKTGGINIIDLANVDSCAFIETKDLGRFTEDARFEVLGRFDNSDIRGCNLLV